MKVFISSLISGFGNERQAARRAVTTLRHEPVMAEDFGAQPHSPQIACLQGLRNSDIVVLILGERYGTVPQGSSISATHQEYREARGSKPVLAFVQQNLTPEPDQGDFIDEVQAWEGGVFRSGFVGPDDLQECVVRALHDLTLANVVGPLNEEKLVARGTSLLPDENRNWVQSTSLDLAIAGGPSQRILRPVQLEEPGLAEHIQQSALFGDHRLFDRGKGSQSSLTNAELVVRQDHFASVRLTEQGELAIHLPLDKPESDRIGSFDGMVIVEEVVQQFLSSALGFAAQLFERIDPSQRITHLALVARISGADYRAWRTRAQHAAKPNSVQVGISGERLRTPVKIVVRRSALRLDRSNIVEDLLVLLRRQFPIG